MKSQLRADLRATTPELRAYVKHLEAEDRKLHSKIVKLELRHLSDGNRMRALEKQLKAGTVRVVINRSGGK